MLFLPQMEQALPAVEVLCKFGAEALFTIPFPRRVVGIGILFDLHMVLKPPLRGLE
jgi:hypothetical protein